MSENTTNHGSRMMDHKVEDDEINLLDLAIVLARHKWLILGLPFAAAILAVIYSLTLPNIYTANTKILPPQQSQSAASAMLAQLGSNFGSLLGLSGAKNPNEIYIAMLKSRTLADNMIQRLDLNTVFQQKRQSDTRAALEGMSKITFGNGLITIEVNDKDPKRAADLANAYVDELYKLTSVLAVTEVSQRRLFFERQLAQAKDNLTKAEIAARQALEKGGLAQVEGHGRAMLDATARLRGQITVKEVQIGAMRTFATERNPELLAAQQELEVMKRELAKMEGVGGAKVKENSAAINSQGTDSLSLLREVKYYETIFELLAKQYELAKIDEARDSAMIQVLDKAIEPDRKSKPNRSLIVILTALAAGVLAVLWAYIREAGQKSWQDPQQAERLNLLRHYVWSK